MKILSVLSPRVGTGFCWMIAATLTLPALAQNLPDGPGKAETTKICGQCHEVARAISLRQDRAGWQTTMEKMISLGAKGSPDEFEHILDYLSTNYPADEIPRIHVNTAPSIELEAGFNLKRSQAAVLIAYRTKHGGFKSLEELKKVPGLDIAPIVAKKDRIDFSN